MTNKRQYLINRLYLLYELNESFYEEHDDLKNHLFNKIKMLEMEEELNLYEE